MMKWYWSMWTVAPSQPPTKVAHLERTGHYLTVKDNQVSPLFRFLNEFSGSLRLKYDWHFIVLFILIIVIVINLSSININHFHSYPSEAWLLFVSLSIYLFIYLSIYLYIYLFIYLSILLSIYLSIYFSSVIFLWSLISVTTCSLCVDLPVSSHFAVVSIFVDYCI